MSTKLNNQDDLSKETITSALKEYMQAKGLSQRDAAVKCGVSDATINKVVNEKWEDISDTMWRKIWNAVKGDQSSQLFRTRDFDSVKKLCESARQRKLMIGLVGDTGMGKTTALRALSRMKNTYYVCFDKTMRARQFFAAILKEMGVAFEGNLHEMVNLISETLNTTSNPLLIIDESGKLTHNVLMYLHVLRDRTIGNCGIVLSGMPYFKTNLLKNSNKQKEGYAEFFRRVNLWYELEGLYRTEIEYICKENGIVDKEEMREFLSKKKFGELMNAILLYQIALLTQD